MSITPFTRRAALKGAALTGAVVGVGALGACTPGTDDPVAPNTAGQAPVDPSIVPTLIPYEGPTPDLPGDGFALPNGYFSYPSGVADAITEKPGDGSKVTIACGQDRPMPPGVGSNAYWQALNETVGAELDFQMVPESDYRARSQTLLAGGAMPDLFQLPANTPDTPAIAEANFADLTEYLSGDNVAEYPFLANEPTTTWEQAIYNEKIFGVRYPLHLMGSFMFARRDLITERGASVDDVTDAESFLDLCREVTDPTANRWALSNPIWTAWYVSEMLGVPAYSQLEWLEEGGTFTQVWETPEFREAMEFTRMMIDEGLFHPDAHSLGAGGSLQQFQAGRVVLNYSGGNQWETRVASDKLDVTAIAPVAFDGSGMGVQALSKGTYSMTAISKDADPDRIRMLLRIMNYMAAPFGTNEYKFLHYGEEGTHHTNTDGNIELTQTGQTEVALPTKYVANPPTWVYIPGHEEEAREYHAFIEKVVAAGVQDAATGLWSETDQSRRGEINVIVNEKIAGYYRGDNTLEDYDTAVADWLDAGGEAIRVEYETAFEARQ